MLCGWPKGKFQLLCCDLQGMVRAEQDQLKDSRRSRVVGLLIHGDAAFAGLGIVSECLQMANVPGQCLITYHLPQAINLCVALH